MQSHTPRGDPVSCHSYAEATPGPVSPPTSPPRDEDLYDNLFPKWMMQEMERDVPPSADLPELVPDTASGPPTLLPLQGPPNVPLDELQREEADARRQIESCVMPARVRMRALIVDSCHSAADVRTLVPWNVWDSDNARLVLAVAVVEGDELVVEEVLSRTAFADMHAVSPSPQATHHFGNFGLEPCIVQQRHGLCVGDLRARSFIELAASALTRALCTSRNVAQHLHIFVSLCSSPFVCWAAGDADALEEAEREAACHPQAAATLDFWKLHLAAARCPHSFCAQGAPPRAKSAPQVRWSPETTHMFSRHFQRRARLLGRVALRQGVLRSLPQVLQYVDWKLTPTAADATYPESLIVCDYAPACGGLVALDASRLFLQHFRADGHEVTCGSQVSLKGDTRGPAMVTGCAIINNRLHLVGRRLGTPHSSPVIGLGDPDQLTLARHSPVRRSGVWWLCGVCMSFQRPQRCTLCRRTLEESVLHCEQHPQGTPGLAPPPPLIEMES